MVTNTLPTSSDNNQNISRDSLVDTPQSERLSWQERNPPRDRSSAWLSTQKGPRSVRGPKTNEADNRIDSVTVEVRGSNPRGPINIIVTFCRALAGFRR